MTTVRDAFFNKIYEMSQNGEEIYIVTADLGAPSLDDFRKDFPERYISVGISEQNLITIACGMALAGKQVVAYGLNPFPITRAYDQIRCLMSELNIPITLCALNAGLCSAECGYTHMPIEDMGMIRVLPNITIYNPSDTKISEWLAEQIVLNKNPRYIRFDKGISNQIYDQIRYDDGFKIWGNTESDITIVTNGIYAKEISEKTNKNSDYAVIDVFAMPLNTDKLYEVLKNSKQIITIEENMLAGGLGSYILEFISDKNLTIPVKRFGLNLNNGHYDVFTNRDYIREDQQIRVEDVFHYIRTVNMV